MVTDISKDEIIYTDTWSTEKADIEKDLEKYNNSPKRFLFYPWGVFLVAAARANLWSGILEFGNYGHEEKGNHYVYSDTDSLKVMNLKDHLPYVFKYNRMCEIKLKQMCKYHGLNYEELMLPKTIKGEVKPIGVWDLETRTESEKYKRYKTLGAKRYLIEHGDGSIEMTVSGVNKHIAVPYLIEKYGKENMFKIFTKGLHIPEGKTGKLTHCYIDYLQSGQFVDYLGNSYTFVNEPPGVYLEGSSYDFDITQEYIEYLKGVQYYK